MQRAATDDTVAAASIQDALGWMRALMLVGADSSFTAEFNTLWDLILKAVHNGYVKSVQRCKANHNLNEIAVMIGIQRTLALLGHSDDSDFSTLLKDIDACVRFELDADVNLTSTQTIDLAKCGKNCGAAGPVSTHFTMHAGFHGLPLRLTGNPFVGVLSGDIQPAYTTWDATITSVGKGDGVIEATCTETSSGTSLGAPAHAVLQIDLNPRTAGTATPVPAITLDIDPGTPVENITGQKVGGQGGHFICVSDSQKETVYQSVWADDFATTPPYTAPFHITDWKYLGGATWATKSGQQTRSNHQDLPNQTNDTSAHDSVDLTLRHTPLP
jgi:hypothetical protein